MLKGAGFHFGGDENVLRLHSNDGYTTCGYTTNPKFCTLFLKFTFIDLFGYSGS